MSFNLVALNFSIKKNKIQPDQIVLFLILAFTLSSCDVITGIFEAGMWVGIRLVIVVIALIIWVIKKIIS